MKDTALREVAKSRVRKMIREKENESVVLKYDTPDENVVPKWQVGRYRELLREELEAYKKAEEEKKKKEVNQRQKQPIRTIATQTQKKQPTKRKDGLFRR